jgi:hypothetical protein
MNNETHGPLLFGLRVGALMPLGDFYASGALTPLGGYYFYLCISTLRYVYICVLYMCVYSAACSAQQQHHAACWIQCCPVMMLQWALCAAR